MKNSTKKWAYLLTAWLGLCLILWLSACKTLQPTSIGKRYQVVLVLPPGSNEGDLAAVLYSVPASQVDFKPNGNGIALFGPNDRLTLITLVLPDETALQQLRQRLSEVGLPPFTINSIDQ